MPITVPVTGDEISASAFGAPVANEVNRLTPLVDSRTPTAWTTVTYQNSWVTEGPQPAQYRKIGDIVYFRGSIKAGTNNTTAWTMPVGFRPPTVLTLPTLYYDAATGWKPCRLYLLTDGQVQVLEAPYTLTAIPINNLFYAV